MPPKSIFRCFISFAMFCCIIFVDGVTITTIPDGFLLENQYLVVNVTTAKALMSVKLPSTGQPDIASGGISIYDWYDEIYYKLSPLDEECPQAEFYFNFTNWTASTGAGPDGSVFVLQQARFGADKDGVPACTASFRVYVTDVKTKIILAGVSIPMDPRQVKYSLDVDCPWHYQLARDLGMDTTNLTNLILVGRRAGPRFRVLIDSDDGVIGRLNIARDIKMIPQPDKLTFPGWDTWRANRCYFRGADAVNAQFQLRGLWPDFDINDTANITVPMTEKYVIVNKFQDWAWADNRNFTNGNVFFNTLEMLSVLPRLLPNGLTHYELQLRLRFEFVDRFQFDPLMEILFYSGGAAPDASPALDEGTKIGGAVGGAVGAAVFVGVIVAFAVSPKFRNTVSPFRKHQVNDLHRSSTDLEPEVAEEPKRRSTWTKGDTTRSSLVV